MTRRGELLYGVRPVLAVLERDPAGVLEIWMLDSRSDALGRRIAARANAVGCALARVPRRTLERLAGEVAHQGVVACYRAVEKRGLDLADLVGRVSERTLVLALDGVQDPHNLGACLRSADAAGAQALLVPRRRSAPLAAGARKAASGASETVPVVRVGNLANALAALARSGVRILGADANAPESVFDCDLHGPLVLVLGGEARGLRRLTVERCDALVRIPMQGRVSSLNVSVAAGVCLFEILRQRRFATPRPIA